MKKLTLLLASIFAMATQTMAHGLGHANINSYADAFVFDEMGITFSVYPDGEFDFYLADACQSTTMSNGFVNVTFNSGYDYNPYVQYDDFGAVIQVENVPVWYDYYGRVTQIGDVMISYRNRRVCQVGGMYVHYNRHGYYAYHTGFINTWNPYFVYRPFYSCFARPVVNLCFVRTTPYRQYYSPVRYTYYRPYVRNVRPNYATIGHTYRPSGYGRVHTRYTQSAGRGERPVTRSRRTVTTADASPRAAVSGQANRAVSRDALSGTGVRSSNGNRSTSGSALGQSSRTSSNGTISSKGMDRTQNYNRGLQTAPSRSGTLNRTVQTAPSRNQTTTRSNSASRPAVGSATKNPTIQNSSPRSSGSTGHTSRTASTVGRSQSGATQVSRPQQAAPRAKSPAQSTRRNSSVSTGSVSRGTSKPATAVSKSPVRNSSAVKPSGKGTTKGAVGRRGN